ncbi:MULTISPECIES: helicase-related protein [Cyanophyceae]|uniref:helicase-related protein n=1 Tax=Cyanophyceae TaxID=3028117 RepID=UPI000A0F27A4|nr:MULTISPECIES: helicase-related protein [Cyanophyceae]SMH58514.1 PLD-like domain-containing protein [Picosynechococcus sp. OG1]SMQ86455.1 PLD-like domain-containing protein [Synechococcus sp. 7002]
MPSSLPDYPWKISYSSDQNNPIADFYIPALERSIQYDRKSGFFGSAILSHIARGLGTMLNQDGKMRLILGCHLSAQDVAAIKKGYELREAVTTRLDADLTPPQNFAQLHHFEILSWLIQAGRLDIRIAIPLKQNGDPQLLEETLDFNHIFHEKVCIFTDAAGNQIATNGSANESVGGWELNTESFHVYCSWEGKRDLERVQEEIVRFEQLWINQMPRVKSFAMPDAIQDKILRYTPSQKPQWNPAKDYDYRPLPKTFKSPQSSSVKEDGDNYNTNTPLNPHSGDLNTSTHSNSPQVGGLGGQSSGDLPDPSYSPDSGAGGQEAIIFEQEMLKKWQALPTDPGCLSYCLESIPITPWPHQIKILRHVVENFPCSFLIADEVGLGKTIETGLILRYLFVSGKAKRILVLAPASVQPQWHSEMREKFNLHFWSYSKGQLTNPDGETCPSLDNPWNTQDLILASSHLVRRRDRMEELLAAEPWDVVIIDEAHHARRKAPQNRKETPNRLLELLQQLREKTLSMVLLSATPMQIDPIEVFDLISVIGLEGHWSYGDVFCDYFATLDNQPNENLLKFWQQMTADYFKYGGKSCPRFQAYLNQSDRLLASRLDDFWSGKYPTINLRQYLNDTQFMERSKEYLSIHTPLKEKMFRHTRNTLREYYKRGLLEKDIPQRDVQDQAIALEPTREAELYRQVSDYVRDFYRLAQKENRKALGFLMTLYRKRLTSSFYAIRESLQRRLDALITQQGSGLSDDDFLELEDQDDAIIDGLESFMEEIHPKEIEFLEELLRQFENTGEDTKFAHLLTILRQEFQNRDSAIIFTQYTDTLDFLRGELRHIYDTQVACYSGRSGEKLIDGEWRTVPKERIKREFRQGEIKILLCTESASEGLNLQTCGVLINYDMPWNPMRVEQRIGRIDRIGQTFPRVIIHNFYYDGTVEARVYQRLRDRIHAFSSVVGSLQPILAKVPTLIERATMSADPQEADVLFSDFDHELDAPPLQVTLDDMVQMDVEADLASIHQPQPPSPLSWQDLERWLTTSPSLKQAGISFANKGTPSRDSEGARQWLLTQKSKTETVTFDPATFEEYSSSLRLMSIGEPLLRNLIQICLKAQKNSLSL